MYIPEITAPRESSYIKHVCVASLSLRSGRVLTHSVVLYQPTGQSLFRYVKLLRRVAFMMMTVQPFTQSTLNPWMPSRCISGARLVSQVVTRYVPSYSVSVVVLQRSLSSPTSPRQQKERSDYVRSYRIISTSLQRACVRSHRRRMTHTCLRSRYVALFSFSSLVYISSHPRTLTCPFDPRVMS